MVHELNEIAIGQGETVDSYVGNIDSAARYNKKSVGELAKTEQKTKYSNTKLVVFAIVVCLMLTVMWLIYSFA